MKLRYIFTMLATALAFLLSGCQEELHFLDEVQVSQSYIALPVAGGQTEITVNANGDWQITGIPEWLSVTPENGGAGETKVTFKAEATEATNEATLVLSCMGVEQHINVIQMAEKKEIPISPIGDVLKAEAGTFRIKGEVYGIYNTQYGNFYMKDETGSILIYGCLDANGAEKNFSSLGIDNGDVIVAEGPLTIYNGTYELVNITVLSIEKSLLKFEEVVYGEVAEGEEAPTAIALEGGSAQVLLTTKAGGVNVEIPEDAQSWLSVGGLNISGTAATVTLNATPNAGGARTTTVTFTAEADGKTYTATADIAQDGAIAEFSVADFLAAEVGTALFKLTGKVANLQAGDYGNFDLVDASGSVYVYGLTATQVEKNDKSFPTLGIKEGDVVTLIGTRAEYKGTAQVGGPAYYVSHIGHTESTVADFLAKEVGDARYKLTGKITNLQAGDYGNFDLVDETGSVYVYGLTVAPVAKNDKSFPTLGLKEGDVVTLIGTRAEYKGAAQVGGPAYYISHTEGTVEPEPETLSVEGKQWLGELEGMQVLFDLGASEEGMAVIALPTEDGAGFALYAAGAYVLNATDETSGNIVCTLTDIEVGEEFTESFLYSELTETSVNIASEGFFGVATPLAFTKATEYIEFTVPGEGPGGDVTENSIESGAYWIANLDLQKVMAPLAEDQNYGYPKSDDMVDGASYAKNAFTFTYNADETRYTIQDSFGRYLYMSGTYNSFNVSAELPAEGAYWSVEARGDGTYDIYNGENGKSISYSPDYGSWEAKLPDDASFSGIYPTLVKADNPVEEPENPGDSSELPSFVSTLSWTLGDNAYDATSSTSQKANINGESVDNVLKLGKSKTGGDCTVTIPAGTKKIGFYAVAWKGKSPVLSVGTDFSVSPKANDGASGNPEPEYIITVTSDDYYEVEVNATAETTVQIATDSERAILFGLNAIK